MKSDTLIVVASYDDRFLDNLPTFKGGHVVRWDTSGGGYTTKAYIDAYRKHYYKAYLFVQDSIRGNLPDVVEPFRDNGREAVAWGHFPMFFDNDLQAKWVLDQYPGKTMPRKGVFGPIFYATRKAMRKLEDKSLLPKTPPNKLMEQGVERAWAFAFDWAGIKLGSLGPCVNDGVSPRLQPSDETFTKIFAGRV